jgi:nucleoside phosphorylase
MSPSARVLHSDYLLHCGSPYNKSLTYMNSGQLRLSNYNYDATVLLERVRVLFDRDDHLLGDAIIRSVLVDVSESGKQHAITRIDILPKGVSLDEPELSDYGTILFVKEPLGRSALLARLELLSEKRIQIGEYTLTSAGIGFRDTYEPNRSSYSEWPCTVFDISFGSVQLCYEPLLHPTLKSFPSTYDAVQKFFKFDVFNGQSDGRLGHIQLAIPNLNARIETLSLTDNRLNVGISGAAPPASLKLSVSYKSARQSEIVEGPLVNGTATFRLAFQPREISIWLVSRSGFVADFHTENEHHSVGGEAILPKDPEAIPLDMPAISLGEMPSLTMVAVDETRRVVILTALSVEYKAVRAHLKNLRENTHPRGTVYEEGEFTASDGSIWRAYIAETGPGNSAAAREAERAVGHFEPEVILFVGVAGGFKDVVIGDVVAVTKVYGYESGKAQREFLPRPQAHNTAYELQQRARAEARREDWFKRVGARGRSKFKVFVGPIASGEKVLASHRSVFSAFLRKNYGDTLAVEMEGWGFLESVHASADVRGLIVRGISDLLDGKSKADTAGSQARAPGPILRHQSSPHPAKADAVAVWHIGRAARYFR